MSDGIEAALGRNRKFAARGGHEGAIIFPKLRLFVVTCIDPRTDPAHFLGLELSDALVLRNVGGRVTPEMIEDVAFIAQLAEGAIPDGPLFEVAIVHHTQCGTGALVDDDFRRRYAERIGENEAKLRERTVLDPGRDRAPRRRATPCRAPGPRPRPGLRPRLRRGQRPGGDGRPHRGHVAAAPTARRGSASC